MYESQKVSARVIPPAHIGRPRRPDAIAAVQVIFDDATGEIEQVYVRQLVKQSNASRQLHLPDQHSLSAKYPPPPHSECFWIQLAIRIPLPDAWIEPASDTHTTIEPEDDSEPEVVEPRDRVTYKKKKKSFLGLEEPEVDENGWPVDDN